MGSSLICTLILVISVGTTLGKPLEIGEALVLSSTESPSTTLQGSESPHPSLEPVSTPQMSSKPSKPQKPLKPELYFFKIESNIRYRYATTYVTSRVANRDPDSAHEVTFSVVLPETAFISKFIMEIDGKSYEAYVKPKDEAKSIYDEATSQGQSAGLVELNKRHSNLFNVAVNIGASSKVNFNLTYEEMVGRRLGRYEQAIDINLAQVSNVKEFEVVVDIEESQNFTKLSVPQFLGGNEIEGNGLPQENPDAVVNRTGGNRARISWKPTSEQLADLLAKDKEGLGKFTVQYDIHRSEGNKGEILLMNGYFVHFFAPTYLKPLKKHVVFILDISGSMWGRKLVQMKEAMNKILADLTSEDFFNILLFSSGVARWTPEDVPKTKETSAWSRPGIYHGSSLTPVKASPNEPYPATPENIKKAQDYINAIEATGGTNIHDAIINALNLTIEIKNASASHHAKLEQEMAVEVTTMVSTSNDTSSEEGGLSDATDVTDVVDETTLSYAEFVNQTKFDVKNDTTNSTKPKTILPKNVESLIIFLTDGEPTVGVTEPTTIQTLISTANQNHSIPIFSLAFGEGADFPFVKKLSLQNNGFARKIYEASDATLQLKGFYNELASPLLSNVTFNYTAGSTHEVGNLTVTTFKTVFGGTEVAVAGTISKKSGNDLESQESEENSPNFYTNSRPDSLFSPFEYSVDAPNAPAIIQAYISGNGYDGPMEFDAHELFTPTGAESGLVYPIRPYPPRPTPPPTREDAFLERLWAYLTIQQLLEKDLASGAVEKAHFDKFAEPSTSTTTEKSANSSNVDIMGNSTSVNETKKETPKEQALRLALKYGFVTPLTSLVVVKPNNSEASVDTVSTDEKPQSGGPVAAGHYFQSKIAAAPVQALYLMSTRLPMPISAGNTNGNSYHKITPHLAPSFAAPSFGGGNYAGGPPAGFGGFSGGFGASQPDYSLSTPVRGRPRPPPQIVPEVLESFVDNSAHSASAESFADIDVGPIVSPLTTEEQQEFTSRPVYTLENIKWLLNDPWLTLKVKGGGEIKAFVAKTNETVENPEKCTISPSRNSTDSASSEEFGIEGECLHLKDCVQEEFLRDFDLYEKKYFCQTSSPKDSTKIFAGVCCQLP